MRLFYRGFLTFATISFSRNNEDLNPVLRTPFFKTDGGFLVSAQHQSHTVYSHISEPVLNPVSVVCLSYLTTGFKSRPLPGLTTFAV